MLDMEECGHCDESFSSKIEKLEHELDEHEEEISGHDRSDKKSELNKLREKNQASKQKRTRKLRYGIMGLIALGLISGAGYWASQNLDTGPQRTINASLGIGEPVHWHAEYELTVCGKDQVLQGGPQEAHTHGEKTLHLEGIRRSREEAELDWIVDNLGGELEEDSIMGQENCNGEPANLTVEVDGEEIEDHLSYVPRDGDSLRITYG